MGGNGGARWSGVKGGKWEKCNSIINKIYFKKKNSIGNVEAKELICITHGHEL